MVFTLLLVIVLHPVSWAQTNQNFSNNTLNRSFTFLKNAKKKKLEVVFLKQYIATSASNYAVVTIANTGKKMDTLRADFSLRKNSMNLCPEMLLKTIFEGDIEWSPANERLNGTNIPLELGVGQRLTNIELDLEGCSEKGNLIHAHLEGSERIVTSEQLVKTEFGNINCFVVSTQVSLTFSDKKMKEIKGSIKNYWSPYFGICVMTEVYFNEHRKRSTQIKWDQILTVL